MDLERFLSDSYLRPVRAHLELSIIRSGVHALVSLLPVLVNRQTHAYGVV
jgi:hypothetical protein